MPPVATSGDPGPEIPLPLPAIRPVLEIKDSSAGCALGCPHSDEEYPRRQPFSEATAVVAPRPVAQPDEPLDTRTRDQSQRLQSHRRRSARGGSDREGAGPNAAVRAFDGFGDAQYDWGSGDRYLAFVMGAGLGDWCAG